MKVLCLHGFRTSGRFLQKQIRKWDPSIFQDFSMVFPDGKYPAAGKSGIEGIFPPPYFEWLQFAKEFTEYANLDESISFLCDYITEHGPFDGLLGFSQGAKLSALILGYQTQGQILQNHPPFKFFVSISGSKFTDPGICEIAYKEPIKVKSVHFIGAKDWLKVHSEDLASAFDNPLIIRHTHGHTVPRLDQNTTELFREWTKMVLLDEKKLAEDNDPKTANDTSGKSQGTVAEA
ncbi:putative serine hydrolase FSH, alpha/Beta hydrolase [Dioscorea sansibarensis]